MGRRKQNNSKVQYAYISRIQKKIIRSVNESKSQRVNDSNWPVGQNSETTSTETCGQFNQSTIELRSSQDDYHHYGLSYDDYDDYEQAPSHALPVLNPAELHYAYTLKQTHGAFIEIEYPGFLCASSTHRLFALRDYDESHSQLHVRQTRVVCLINNSSNDGFLAGCSCDSSSAISCFHITANCNNLLPSRQNIGQCQHIRAIIALTSTNTSLDDGVQYLKSCMKTIPDKPAVDSFFHIHSQPVKLSNQ